MSSRLTHLLSCHEASALLSRSQDERLPWLQRFKVRWHVALCGACTRFERQLATMRSAMQRYRS